MPRYAAAAQRQQLGLDEGEDAEGLGVADASVLDGPLHPEVQHELQVGGGPVHFGGSFIGFSSSGYTSSFKLAAVCCTLSCGHCNKHSCWW
jgi:hypothetical protein